MNLLREEFMLLDDEPGIFVDGLGLVVRHEVKGLSAHDADHAAAARRHGLTHVLTLDPGDFQRYDLSGLTVLTP